MSPPRSSAGEQWPPESAGVWDRSASSCGALAWATPPACSSGRSGTTRLLRPHKGPRTSMTSLGL
eukprot:7025693-Lingulodinium_polyedra.AAC.1